MTAIAKSPLYSTPKPCACAMSSMLEATSAALISSSDATMIATGAFLKKKSSASMLSSRLAMRFRLVVFLLMARP